MSVYWLLKACVKLRMKKKSLFIPRVMIKFLKVICLFFVATIADYMNMLVPFVFGLAHCQFLHRSISTEKLE